MEIMHSSSKEIESSSDSKKCCSICKTTKTPLWRSGPTGPKSLCNACGIKYRKRRGKDVKPLKGHDRKKQKSSSAVSAEAEAEAEAEVGDSKAKEGKMGKEEGGKLLKVRLAPLGKEVVPLQRQRSPVSRRRKLGEVERAAALLMALSCGSVFG